MPTNLDVQLLGEFHLLYDGRPLTAFFQGRIQALLAYLLLHRDVPQSRQRLAFLFWPDSVEPQARNNLRQLLHYLRRELPSADRFVLTDSRTVQWRPEAPYALDVATFERALADAAAWAGAEQEEAERAALERAAQVYGGELLPGRYEDWILAERERLALACLNALQRLMVLAEAEGDLAAAIAHGERLLAQDPLHETSYCELMRLHALNGDRVSALRVYHRCIAVLQRELGVGPGAAVQVVYRGLLN